MQRLWAGSVRSVLEGVGLAALFIERRPLLIRDFWSLKKEEKGNGGHRQQVSGEWFVWWLNLKAGDLLGFNSPSPLQGLNWNS